MRWIIGALMALSACQPPASATPSSGADKEYKVGDAVRAQWSKSLTDFDAHITSVTPTGYIVRFDSDGIVQAVDKNLRVPAAAPPPPAKPDGPDTAIGAAYTLGPDGPYHTGDAVVALWNGKSGGKKWFQGHVHEVRAADIVIDFSDGTMDAAPAEQVRHRVGGDPPRAPTYKIGPDGPFKKGDAVVVTWGPFNRLVEAHVVDSKTKDVSVQFDFDGAVETVAKNKLQHRIGGKGQYVAPAPAAAAVAEQAAPAMPVGYLPGQKVRVFWKTTNGWYSARVLNIQPDGAVVIKYDSDGVVVNITDASEIAHNN